MKLEKFALVAEIGSAIAMVITVVILILGIQENSDLTRLSIYTDHIDAINRWSEGMNQDPELVAIYVSYPEMEIPSEGVGFMRLNQSVQTLFRIYETAWFSRDYAVIGDREWERFERAISDHYERAESYGLIYRAALTEAFLKYMESSCDASGE